MAFTQFQIFTITITTTIIIKIIIFIITCLSTYLTFSSMLQEELLILYTWWNIKDPKSVLLL